VPVPKFTTARIRVDVNEVVRWLQMEKRYWEEAERTLLGKVADRGLEILKEEVPEGKTRELYDSCWSEVVGHTARVGTAVPYDKFIDGDGMTASSPGRYVPAIGKRLVMPSKRNPSIGTHPGSRQTPFSRRTAERMVREAEVMLDEMVRGAPK